MIDYITVRISKTRGDMAFEMLIMAFHLNLHTCIGVELLVSYYSILSKVTYMAFVNYTYVR